jgi:hypothetical protein
MIDIYWIVGKKMDVIVYAGSGVFFDIDIRHNLSFSETGCGFFLRTL